jgi:hypothetical protein
MLTGVCHCGASHWTFEGDPGPATACNCTLCRRYGALWVYDYEGERIGVSGQTASYKRADKADPSLEILFCPTCGGVLCWRGLKLDAIDHFDGLQTFEDLARDGRCVRDLWF